MVLLFLEIVGIVLAGIAALLVLFVVFVFLLLSLLVHIFEGRPQNDGNDT